MGKDSYIEVKIEGVIDGGKITPTTVDIGRYKEFLTDIEYLIAGDIKRRDKEKDKITIEVEESSLLVRAFIVSFLSIQISAEIEEVSRTEYLNDITPERAKIIEKWQRKAEKSGDIKYSIVLNNRVNPFEISKETKWAFAQDIWYDTELYLLGKIQEWGGSTNPNIHIVTDNYGTVIVGCEEGQIASQTENKVFHEALLHINAKQNISTGDIKDAKLLDFEDYKPGSANLEEAIREGTDDWKDVKDATKWKRELRGEL